MEEARDQRLGTCVSLLQAWVRGRISRAQFKKLQEQRVSLVVVQRNLRKYQAMCTWSWFMLWQKVKALLNVERPEDKIRALEERVAKAKEGIERESKLRKDLEASNVSLAEEKNNIMATLESNKGSMTSYLELQAKLQAERADIEAQLSVSNKRIRIFLATGIWLIKL